MEAHQQSDVMIMEKMKSRIKGKRTKRRRTSSTLTLTIASTGITSTSSSSSTTTTTNETGTTPIESTNTLQENHTNNDQYIANCLMLLAHGHQIVHSPTPLNMVVPPRSNVYECKTCDRGFTSFQALGGHSASHSKPPKDAHELSKNRAPFLIRTPNNPFSCNIPSGSIKGPKVHQCSLCGLDFTSGQALGGHMRRHRSLIMTTNTTSTSATTCNTLYGCHESKKRKILPPLDLNLRLL